MRVVNIRRRTEELDLFRPKCPGGGSEMSKGSGLPLLRMENWQNLRITAEQCYILCVADSPPIIVRTIDPANGGITGVPQLAIRSQRARVAWLFSGKDRCPAFPQAKRDPPERPPTPPPIPTYPLLSATSRHPVLWRQGLTYRCSVR
jgi:hypothetical protein